MIPEQALFHLPEILVGTSNPRQKHESGVVAAYSLALLQALNSRNITNPVGRIQAERAYQIESWPNPKPKGKPLYHRSDLYVNFKPIGLLNSALSAYGWRRRCRFEVKFMRVGTPPGDSSASALLADLLRLLALVQNIYVLEGEEKKIDVARYLLHVYDRVEPRSQYLAKKRDSDDLPEWLETLLLPGTHTCAPFKLGKLSETVQKQIGRSLSDLTVSFMSTTTIAAPILDLGEKKRKYACVLNRIDSFKISCGSSSLAVGKDRSITWSPDRAEVVENVRKLVATQIKRKEKVDGERPDPIQLPEKQEID